jgi:hypothetical protein
MKYVALEKEYEIGTNNHGKVLIPKNSFEVPQCETVPELIEFIGGEANLLEFCNDAISAGAKNKAAAKIRTAPKESVIADVIASAIVDARNYAPSAERGASKKAILAGVDSLRAKAEAGELSSLSQADLLAMLQQSLGIKVKAA